MAKIYGALEVAQLEWFTDAGKPAAASYAYRVIYVTDLKEVQISDGSNWIAWTSLSEAQTISGNKTFSGQLNVSGSRNLTVTTDSSTSGAINNYNNTTPALELTNAGVTSISGFANSQSGRLLILVNRTGVSISILDEGSGSTAANRIRTGTGAPVSLANNASTTFIYMSDSRWHMISGTGTGSSSGTNFITNGTAEADTSGWATYADAAGSSPVDGTGGSPTVTWTRTTTTPLVGTASFLFTKDAANRQGQGASFDFTIDSAYQAKMLNVSFEYAVASGTFAAGTLTSDSDITIWVYDKTNNSLIQLSSFRLLASSTLSNTFFAQFQTASNSTSYRLIFHCATTSASAYTVEFDNISVSPAVAPPVFGAIPATIQRFTSGSGTYTTPANVKYIKVKMVGGGGGGGGNGGGAGGGDGGAAGGYLEFVINTPASSYSYAVGASGAGGTTGSAGGSTTFGSNTCGGGSGGATGSSSSRQGASGGTNTASLGNIIANIPGSPGQVGVSGAGSAPGGSGGVSPFGGAGSGSAGSGAGSAAATNSGSGGGGGGNSAGGGAGAAGVIIVEEYYQTAGVDSGRLIDFVGTKGSTQALTANTTDVTYTTVKDSHSAWNGSVYTVPEFGDYIVSGQAVNNAAAGVRWSLYVDGALLRTFFDSDASQNVIGATTIVSNLRSGQTISIRCGSSITAAALGSLSISKIQSPAVISATETIAASYWLSANFSASTTTPINFDSKEFDTHSAVTTSASAWKFTAPVSGTYQISEQLYLTVGSNTGITIYKNGSAYKFAGNATNNNGQSHANSTLVQLLAGDTIDLRPIAAVTVAGAALNTQSASTISILRVGI